MNSYVFISGKMNSTKEEEITQNQIGINEKAKQKWTTLHVPVETLDTLKRIKARSKEDKANWKIITEALSYYSSVISSPRKLMSVDNSDKVAWYIMKVTMTFGKFLDNPTEENFNLLNQRLDEIKQRLNANVETVKKLSEQYMRTKNEEEKMKTRVTLNQAVKMLIKEMITLSCSSEDEIKD